tara:strand:- start:348 stop:905 length:558 start_codon:yes stop_codon:yes gene_type:complete
MSTSKPLVFKGIAHGPGSLNRKHPADLSSGELVALEGSALNGIPIHVEHDTSATPVGNVLASYEGAMGELRVIGQVNDPNVAKQVLDGSMRGLSLGTDCVQDLSGHVLSRSQKELSICGEGRRTGTWITDINNQTVHTVACFSKNSPGMLSVSALVSSTCPLATISNHQQPSASPVPSERTPFRR